MAAATSESRPLPSSGCLTCQDIQKASPSWREGTEARGKAGGEPLKYWEVDLPVCPVPDLIRGEQAMGCCRFLVKKEVPGPERPAAGTSEAAAVSGSTHKKKVHTTHYHCQYGPETVSAAEDVTQLRKEAPGSRRSKKLAGRSIKVGCTYRFIVYQTWHQADLPQPMATVRWVRGRGLLLGSAVTVLGSDVVMIPLLLSIGSTSAST